MSRHNINFWLIAYLTVLTTHTDLLISVHGQGFSFPDDPSQPAPPQPDVQQGLDGRQGTTLSTLPKFPTLPASPTSAATVATIATVSPGVNIVTPIVSGQTCICIPTGSSCTGTGSNDGSGLIDIRIVTNPSTGTVQPTTSTTSCAAGLVLCCQPGPYQCGARYPPVARAPAPAAGQAPYGAYPWQAVLLAPGDVYLGSGVLLNNLNVLTAAHKVSQYINSPSTIRVRMGEWNAAGATEPIPAQEFIVSRIFMHPNFNSANLKNDVAILRLSTAVPLGNTPTVATGCLPSTSFAGSRCYISGWGRNDFIAGSFQSIQKQVDVPILQPQQCQSLLAATRLGSTFVFDSTSFICAGGEVGKDACTGDGGSPLVCAIGNRWFVAGLVAWGIGCGTANIPGVYVNVASYVPWIQTTVAS